MLIYDGSGRHITGIPARDLTDDEITQLARNLSMEEQGFIDLMLERGLYSLPHAVTESKQTWQHTPMVEPIQPETWQWTSDIEGALPTTDENEEGE